MGIPIPKVKIIAFRYCFFATKLFQLLLFRLSISIARLITCLMNSCILPDIQNGHHPTNHLGMHRQHSVLLLISIHHPGTQSKGLEPCRRRIEKYHILKFNCPQFDNRQHRLTSFAFRRIAI